VRPMTDTEAAGARGRARWLGGQADVPDEVAAGITQAGQARKVRGLIKALPSDEEFEAMARAGAAKKDWYVQAARLLREVHGEDTPRFVSLLAATSPRQPVNKNLLMTLRIWNAWEEAGRPTETITRVLPLTDDDGNPVLDRKGNPRFRTMRTFAFLKDIPGAEFGSRLPNLMKALTHPDENAPLSGMKVDSFRRNLLGDMGAVVNDVWMANFADIDQGLFGGKLTYELYSDRVRRVAKKLGWDPAEVQAAVWSGFRTMAALRKGGASREESLQQLTHEHVLTTPAFQDLLLGDINVRRELDRVGIGEGVRAAAGQPGQTAAGSGIGRSGPAIPLGLQ
jgi:hypothetical protein